MFFTLWWERCELAAQNWKIQECSGESGIHLYQCAQARLTPALKTICHQKSIQIWMTKVDLSQPNLPRPNLTDPNLHWPNLSYMQQSGPEHFGTNFQGYVQGKRKRVMSVEEPTAKFTTPPGINCQAAKWYARINFQAAKWYARINFQAAKVIHQHYLPSRQSDTPGLIASVIHQHFLPGSQSNTPGLQCLSDTLALIARQPNWSTRINGQAAKVIHQD